MEWILKEGGEELDGRYCLDTSSGWIAITRLINVFEDCDPQEIERVRRLIINPVSYLVEWKNEDFLDRFVRAVPSYCNVMIDNDHGLICIIQLLKYLPVERWLNASG